MRSRAAAAKQTQPTTRIAGVEKEFLRGSAALQDRELCSNTWAHLAPALLRDLMPPRRGWSCNALQLSAKGTTQELDHELGVAEYHLSEKVWI